MRRLAAVIIILTLLFSARAALAHANLEHADPPANAALMQPPDAIRLTFTEPLEAEFSGITLLDANGARVDTPTAILDPDDAHQLILRPGDLPDGLYTVSWRALSAADGHATQGSYAFTLGLTSGTGQAGSQAVETIPDYSVSIRWLNFLGMSLALGSIGFWLLVWNPCGFSAQPNAEKRMARLIWLGWFVLGGAGVAALLLQLSVATGTPLWQPRSLGALEDFLSSTRYGTLWAARMILWFAMGNALVFASDDRRVLWVALVLGLGVLLTNSLFSHAAVAPDQAAAVAGDWLHLTMTALWVGGLLQFLNVIV
jgi:copper transport protein